MQDFFAFINLWRAPDFYRYLQNNNVKFHQNFIKYVVIVFFNLMNGLPVEDGVSLLNIFFITLYK